MNRTVEDRVRATYQRLLVIEAALNVASDFATDREELRAGLAELAYEAGQDIKVVAEAPW